VFENLGVYRIHSEAASHDRRVGVGVCDGKSAGWIRAQALIVASGFGVAAHDHPARV